LPVDLAVIPRFLGDDLARALKARAGSHSASLSFHQHGFAHTNHEPTGRKYEFGPSRPQPVQYHDIAEGRVLLQDQLGPLLDPIFTPPWNRCTLTTARCLVDLGFKVLSREATAPAFDVSGLIELPVRVDWFAHRKRVRLSRIEFGELLAANIEPAGPVGIMFHHAIMDRDERLAAAELLTFIAEHDRVRTHSMLTLTDPRQSTVVPGR
jgi:hypothetical protein